MKYLKQFMIILSISLMGEILHAILPLPIPASIYGIVLLFVLLVSGRLSLDQVKETGKFLVEIMPVMFIPAAVGLMESWDVIRPSWLTYILVTVISTILVMGISGVITQQIIRRKGGR